MQIQIIDDPGETGSLFSSVMLNRDRMATRRAFYGYTTENLKATLEALLESHPDQVRGNVCTISGSGDHMQNFALAGSEEITAIDYSLAALYFADFKWVASNVLDYESFLKFFELGEIERQP